MKQFGTGNGPFTAPNGDVPNGAPEELNRPTNQAFNAFYQTGKSIIEIAGNALTPADGTDENPALVGQSVVKIAREQIGAYVTTTGVANNYVASLTPAIDSLSVGLAICIVLHVSSFGSQVLITVGSNSPKIVKTVDTSSGAKVDPLRLTAGVPYYLIYDGIDFVIANDSRYGAVDSNVRKVGAAALAPQASVSTSSVLQYCPFGGKIIPYSFLTLANENSGDAAIRNLIYIDEVPHAQEQTFGSSAAFGGFLVTAGQIVSMRSEATNVGTTSSSNGLTIAFNYIYVGGI